MINFKCRVCGNSANNRDFFIKEMMFGLGEIFRYIECADCGCLQINEIPFNIEKYYPKNYYSLRSGKENWLKEYVRKKRDSYVISNEGFFGKLISTKFPNVSLHILRGLLYEMGIDKNSKILDVGCGNGNLIRILANNGFKNLTGTDPYIIEKCEGKNFKIIKTELKDLSNSMKYNLIMYNHSLEHMQDQHKELKNVKELLEDNGVLLVSMPVKSDYIWRRYGVYWVQIDAPRHFMIHTEKSFRQLSRETGYKIQQIIYDSTEFQFWGSEQYKMGIPLESYKSYSRNYRSIFLDEKIEEYRIKAKKLNQCGAGDSAKFVLSI